MVKNGENFYGESGREIGKFLHFSPFFTMNTSPVDSEAGARRGWRVKQGDGE